MGLREQFQGALFNSLRLAFRMTPVSEATRDRLRQRFLDRFAGLVPPGPRGQAGGATARRPRLQSARPAVGFVPHRREALPSPLPATLVAFYLPQFHTIPENDEWWGQGFTEWRNVSRALPQFEGHAQPRLPGGLGYYDLRNPQIMRDQAALARDYGIGAFCFYFYWFGGKTLLESPLEQWLHDPEIELPFCLCWANEGWTRGWDGRADDVLIGQDHDANDDIAFISHVSRYLRDPRYLRCEGKPLLLVYRPGLLPDARATADRWRTWCRANGVGEICITYVQGFERPDPRDIGFDAAVEFPPNLAVPTNITAQQRLINPGFSGQVLDWRALAADYRQRAMPAYRLFPGVNCGWDNEPRRPGQGRTYLHASPRGYRDWLQHTITSRLGNEPAAQRLVFVNAWNEWAEGAVLEPDSRLGHAFLQATRSALGAASGTALAPSPTRLCVVVHAWYADTFDEILVALQASGVPMRLVVTTAPEKAAQIQAVLDRRQVQAEIEVRENRGRDILPFLHVANRLLDEGEDVVLKLHSKRSPQRDDGDRWRKELLERLLSPARASEIFQAFARDRGLGMVAPDGHVQPLGDYWGANEANVYNLAARIGIPAPAADSDQFIPGSMFWVRLEALRPLLDAHLEDEDFEPEAAQVDGTFAHAIERAFVLCMQHQGLHLENAAAACGEAAPTLAIEPYPYASRG